MAANSFTSVSLDPPLVLFCAASSSTTWPRIQRAGAFTVNILGEHQEDISTAVRDGAPTGSARSGWRHRRRRSPILDDVHAYLDCTIEPSTRRATT